MPDFPTHYKGWRMRGGRMLELGQYSIFGKYTTTMKETSLDGNNEQKEYMTDSLCEVINFDQVKEEYVRGLSLSELPKSNDALLETKQGLLVFVEFKNGYMDRSKQFALRKKIYDSVLIFCDITSCKVSDLRKNMEYVLVYNEVANEANPDPELRQKHEVQPSSSFDLFAKTIGGYAGEEYICFGLNLFQNYCFKRVHTFTKQEFETYLPELQS